MKESQAVSRIGRELPKNWRWARLGEVCEIIAGQSPPGETYRKHPEGLPFFQGKADFGPQYPIPRTWCVSPTKIALPGDILISVRAPVGPTNIADRECCIGRGLAAIRPGNQADRDFILAALKLLEAELVKLGSGSTFSAINRKDLETLDIPLPPLVEQKRIAAILNEQMAVVERARADAEAQLEISNALPGAFFREMFFGITPLSAEQSSKATPPVGWNWKKLSSIARLESGHTPSRYHIEWWGGNIPWLSLSDIRELDGKIINGTKEYTNADGIANSSARVLPMGTVVLSRTASVGFVAIMGKEMATSQDFVNWVCGPGIDPYFLAYLLRASREYIHSLSSGAIHKTVYVPTVKAFEVCIPPIEKQRSIVKGLNGQIDSADSIQEKLEIQLESIGKLPAAFLRQAFRGQL